jgi:hypothetical protein
MNAAQLISEARRHGTDLLVVDGKLKARPPGLLPADLKAQLAARAKEVKQALSVALQPAGPDRTRAIPAIARDVAPDSRHPLIDDVIRAKIEAIERDARAKGWPAELLWSRVYWDLPRGLAATLDPDDEIGQVTPDYIEILKCRRDIERFMRRIG